VEDRGRKGKREKGRAPPGSSVGDHNLSKKKHKERGERFSFQKRLAGGGKKGKPLTLSHLNRNGRWGMEILKQGKLTMSGKRERGRGGERA